MECQCPEVKWNGTWDNLTSVQFHTGMNHLKVDLCMNQSSSSKAYTSQESYLSFQNYLILMITHPVLKISFLTAKYFEATIFFPLHWTGLGVENRTLMKRYSRGCERKLLKVSKMKDFFLYLPFLMDYLSCKGNSSNFNVCGMKLKISKCDREIIDKAKHRLHPLRVK